MSTKLQDSLALMRNGPHKAYAQLAEDHLQHDLNADERAILEKAAGKVSMHVTVGSLVGIGLGLALAFRLRQSAVRIFQTVKRAEKPIAFQYKDGHTEPLPDMDALMRGPSTLSTVLTATLFSVGGLFLGGEIGTMTGLWSAKSTLNHDPVARGRIEKAFRNFQADVLRKQADAIQAGKEELDF
eukprot:Phypoly_transcript_19935.p1 GENE.Phypoly_transcript_19935~~Phypoly_transcript_19935.p1  ORF type:complete len:184 (+),score=23.69 Phypoly_transcript_19935:91-642(+)